MSTILKALKKLEQEKQDQRHTLPGHLLLGSGASGQNRRGPFGWSRRKWIRRILATGLVIFLGTTTIYFYKQSRSNQVDGSTAVKDRPPAAATVAKLDSPTTNPPEKRQSAPSPPKSPRGASEAVRKPNAGDMRRSPEVGPDTAPTARQSPPRGQTAPAPAKKAERTAPQRIDGAGAKSFPEAVTKAGPPPSASSKTDGSQSTAVPETAQNLPPQPVRSPEKGPSISQQVEPSPTTATTEPQAAPPAFEARSPYQDVPLLTDGRLKVQALAWSPAAEDRMAVINTRIVREGDRVDGFTVVSIQNDDVFVQEKGVVYRVAFGRP